MSNHTTYRLRFVAPRREMLVHVIQYLERKKERCDAWLERGKASEDLLERIGARHCGAALSWGFNFGEIEVDEDGEASVAVTSWANENSLGNVHISGKESELADLIKKFPFLEVSGTYQSEYRHGEISGARKL